MIMFCCIDEYILPEMSMSMICGIVFGRAGMEEMWECQKNAKNVWVQKNAKNLTKTKTFFTLFCLRVLPLMTCFDKFATNTNTGHVFGFLCKFDKMLLSWLMMRMKSTIIKIILFKYNILKALFLYFRSKCWSLGRATWRNLGMPNVSCFSWLMSKSNLPH